MASFDCDVEIQYEWQFQITFTLKLIIAVDHDVASTFRQCHFRDLDLLINLCREENVKQIHNKRYCPSEHKWIAPPPYPQPILSPWNRLWTNTLKGRNTIILWIIKYKKGRRCILVITRFFFPFWPNKHLHQVSNDIFTVFTIKWAVQLSTSEHQCVQNIFSICFLFVFISSVDNNYPFQFPL